MPLSCPTVQTQGLSGNRKNLAFEVSLEQDVQMLQRSRGKEGYGEGAGRTGARAGRPGWLVAGCAVFQLRENETSAVQLRVLRLFLNMERKIPSLFPLLERRPFPAFLPPYLKKVNYELGAS